jgi:hypothetical protein
MSDLFDIRSGTMNLATAALTGLSGGATTISTTGTPAYMLNGKLLAATAQSGGATPTTDIATGAAFIPLATGKGCVFVFGWDSSAPTVASVAQGKVVNAADVTNKSATYDFPQIPATFCPFAYVTISYVGSGTWTFGTSNWNATTATIGTVINCALLPNQPLTAASA